MLKLGLLASLALVPILWSCDGDDPGTNITCGAGTMLVGAECRADGSPVTCAKGTVLSSGTCVPSGEACGAGTILDATGVCVPTAGIDCGAGTVLDGDQCVLDPSACRAGTTFDPQVGGCIPNLSCRAGEVAVDGVCLTPEEIDASMADVIETLPDVNDPAFGGAPETLPAPAIGDSTIFTGTIEAPVDRNGDFRVDQDWDLWSFTAASGDTFEIVLRSLGSTELGFVITGPNGYRRLSPLYFQPEPSRHVVLPYAGAYTIAIAPQLVIESVTDAPPIGGDEYQYVAVLEHEAFPTASDLSAAAAVTGELIDLTDNVHRVRSTAGSLLRIAFDPVGRDARPILLAFDGAGAFTEELDLPAGAQAGLVHRASTADDLILLMDFVRLVGPDDDYRIEVVEILPTDVGVIPPDGTVTSTDVELAAGETAYFVAEVSAGQVVEISVDGGAAPPDLRAIAPDGAVIASVAGSATSRFYAAVAGRYTLELVSNDAAAATFTATFASITPVAVGPLDPAVNTATAALWAPPVAPGDNAYFVVSAAQPVALAVAASQQGNANLTLAIYDLRFGALRQLPLGGTAPALSAFLPNAGAVIVEVVDESFALQVIDLTLDVSVSDLPPLEGEPNDDPTLATPLALGSPLFGEIDQDDDDYFRITLLAPLSAGELLELRATDADETDPYTCQLLSGAGAILEEQTPRHRGCVIFAGGLGAGDYYFLVQKAEIERRVYRAAASIIPGVREQEPNDDLPGDTILDLAGAIPMYGECATNADADVFTFTLPADLGATELLSVRIETVGTRPTGSLQTDLTGPNGLNTFFVVAPFGAAVRAGLSAGDYQVRMSRTSANNAFDGHYRIAVSTASVSVVDAEPNDAATEAQPLGALPAEAVGLLSEPTTNDDDWFAFDLPQDLAADETLALELHRIGAQPTESLRVALFDAAQTFLASTNTGDPRRLTQSALAAGTYYVRVDSTFNSTLNTDYLIRVAVE